MQNNNIRSLINIPRYKITKIEKTETKIHIRIEPYKRDKGICSGCGEHHPKVHSIRKMTAEDMQLGERRVFLNIPKRKSKCPKDGIIHTEVIPNRYK